MSFADTRVAFNSAGNLSLGHGLYVGLQGFGVLFIVSDDHPGARDDIHRTELLSVIGKHRNVFAEALRIGSLDLSEIDTIKGTGLIQGIQKVDFVDMAWAIKSSRIIINTAPAGPPLTNFLEQLSKYDLSKHIVIGEPENYIMLHAYLHFIDLKKMPKFWIGTASAPFAVRRTGMTVDISGIKDKMPIAANLKNEFLKQAQVEVAPLFPAEQVLKWVTFFDLHVRYNVNPFVHLPAILAGKPDIDAGTKGSLFYSNWVPRAVPEILRLDDQIRRPLLRAFGFPNPPLIDDATDMYKELRDLGITNWGEIGNKSSAHRNIPGPQTKENRYTMEEVIHFDYFASLMKIAGLDPTPAYKMIDRTEEWLGRRLVERGDFFKKLGLEGASKDQALAKINGY